MLQQLYRRRGANCKFLLNINFVGPGYAFYRRSHPWLVFPTFPYTSLDLVKMCI